MARCCHVAASDLDALARSLADAFHELDRTASATKPTRELPRMKPGSSEPDGEQVAITSER